MESWRTRNSHRAWEDWFGIVLGIVIALSPWATNETSNQPAVLNAAVAGLLVMLLAELDLVSIRRWAEAGQMVCGVWVAISSWIFGYSGTLRVLHLIAGLLVALLGALELWQYVREKKDRQNDPRGSGA